MAATGYTPIYLYYSSTSTNAPSAGNLGYGELAINITDKNLFFKDNTNAVNTVPIRQSSGSSDGWLSSANWTTFNSKQAALVSGTNIKTVSGTTLLGSGDLGTIGVGYGGTGTSTAFTAGSIVFAGASGVYTQNNAQFFWDNTNKRLGILTATPAKEIEINGLTNSGIRIRDSNYAYKIADITYASGGLSLTSGDGMTFGVNSGQAMQIASTGGVSIGNTTDPGAGNLRFNTTGSNGIYFGASSQLNDYESGSYTPVLTCDTGTITSYTSSGRYVKVGNQVFAQFQVTVTNIGTGAGACYISVPYTNNASLYAAGTGTELNVTGAMFVPYLAASGTRCTIYKYQGSLLFGNLYAYVGSITYTV